MLYVENRVRYVTVYQSADQTCMVEIWLEISNPFTKTNEGYIVEGSTEWWRKFALQEADHNSNAATGDFLSLGSIKSFKV